MEEEYDPQEEQAQDNWHEIERRQAEFEESVMDEHDCHLSPEDGCECT